MSRYLILTLLLNACTLVHRERPNQPPILQSSWIDTLRIATGGVVRLQVRATDEDDDPLYYNWQAYRLQPETLQAIEILNPGGLFTKPPEIRELSGHLGMAEPIGGFRDSIAQVENSWTAPSAIRTSMERFLLAVTIRDRYCELIADPAGRQRCIEETHQLIQIFILAVLDYSRDPHL